PDVVVAWWTTDRYHGPMREPQRAPEMLFTEAQYRSWAMVARWLAEAHLVPRNFPLLPHKTRTGGDGDPARTGMKSAGPNCAKIGLADEIRARARRTFGVPANPVPPTADSLRIEYEKGTSIVPNTRDTDNKYWKAGLLAYRGIAGHGFAGDADNGDHDCP